MILKKWIAHSFILLSVITVIWLELLVALASAFTTPISLELISQSKIFNQPRRPPLGQGGGNLDSNGPRGPCASVPLGRITALVPSSAEGLTTEAFPTFWFYVPYTRTSGIEEAKFVLLDEDLRIVVQPTDVTLPDTAGVISFQLPNTVAPLEVGKSYNWYFSVICDAEKPSRNPVVSGWVERVAPSVELTNQLRVTPTGREYLAYGENGIWFDALTQLAQQRCRIPQNSTLEADWRTLLQDIGLENLTSQPINCS